MRAIKQRSLTIKSLVAITEAAGSSTAETDIEALRHWLAGRRNIRSDRLERALWALGVSEENLADILRWQENPIYYVWVRGEGPLERRLVQETETLGPIEVVESVFGVQPDSIHDYGRYDYRRFYDDVHSGRVYFQHYPGHGVWIVSRPNGPQSD